MKRQNGQIGVSKTFRKKKSLLSKRQKSELSTNNNKQTKKMVLSYYYSLKYKSNEILTVKQQKLIKRIKILEKLSKECETLQYFIRNHRNSQAIRFLSRRIERYELRMVHLGLKLKELV